jgi:hypothetical protein
MFAEFADRILVFGVWVAVLRAYDDNPEGRIVSSAWRKHCGGKRASLPIAQGQEHGHGSLNMAFETDIPLDERAGSRFVAPCCPVPSLAEVFFDRMGHDMRFESGFPLGVDPEPGLLPWGVTDELHAPSTQKSGHGSRLLQCSAMFHQETYGRCCSNKSGIGAPPDINGLRRLQGIPATSSGKYDWMWR